MVGIAREIVHILAELFSALLLLTIMLSGLVMMVRPEKAQQILKNAAIAAALFLLGLTIARSCVNGLR